MPSLYYFSLWTFAFWFFWLQQTTTKLIPANWKIRESRLHLFEFPSAKDYLFMRGPFSLLFWHFYYWHWYMNCLRRYNEILICPKGVLDDEVSTSYVSKGFRLNGNHQNMSFYIRSFKFRLSFHGRREIGKAQGIGIDRFVQCPLLWTKWFGQIDLQA